MIEDGIATDESEFWERRRELTVDPVTGEDIDRRAAGGGRQLVLLAHVTEEAVRDAFRPVLERLGAFECLEPTPVRNLHVTVKLFGNVVTDPEGRGEFSPRERRRIADELGDAVAAVPAFPATFPRCNLFPDVVYAEVNDGGRFATLNERVCDLDGVPVWGRDREGFIPHCTLGQFTQQEGYRRLLDHLEAERQLDVPPLTVDELRLVTLDFSNGRFPPYETVEQYTLPE